MEVADDQLYSQSICNLSTDRIIGRTKIKGSIPRRTIGYVLGTHNKASAARRQQHQKQIESRPPRSVVRWTIINNNDTRPTSAPLLHGHLTDDLLLLPPTRVLTLWWWSHRYGNCTEISSALLLLSSSGWRSSEWKAVIVSVTEWVSGRRRRWWWWCSGID